MVLAMVIWGLTRHAGSASTPCSLSLWRISPESLQNGNTIRDDIRAAGYGVTTFQGEGMQGPVMELYIVCRRKDVNEILPIITRTDPDAFYTTEQAGMVSRLYRPTLQSPTGWRAIFKKK